MVLFFASWKKFPCDTADPLKLARNNSSLLTSGTNLPGVSHYLKYNVFQDDTEIRQLIQVWEIIFTFKIPVILFLCGGLSFLEVSDFCSH